MKMRRTNAAILANVVIFAALSALLINCGPSAPPPAPRVSTVNSIDGKMEKAGFDETLLKVAVDKAKQLRVNPIPLAANRSGTIMAVGNGTALRVRMSRLVANREEMTEMDFRVTSGMVPVSMDEKKDYSLVFREGDMVCNVGNAPIPLGDITLQKGEYAIFRQGLKKQGGLLGGATQKIEASEEPEPDPAIIDAGKRRAAQLGLNPIPVYANRDGEIIICKGALFTIRNNRWAATEGDMIINAGPGPISVGNYSLAKGEAAVVRNGKFEKLPDKLGLGEKMNVSTPKGR